MTSAYQPPLFEEEPYQMEFDSDSWETPDWLAQKLAQEAIAATGMASPFTVEVGAGNGRISRYLPPLTYCIEAKRSRYERGRVAAPDALWVHGDFLAWYKPGVRPDLIVGNIPFSLAPAIIDHALEIVSPNGVIVFLMPGDTMHKPSILNGISRPFTFTAKPIVGRVGFIGQDGNPKNDRQIYDSIFFIRPTNKLQMEQWVRR